MRPWIAALLLGGCASEPPRQPPPPPAPPGAPEIRAVRVPAPPTVDGIANDSAWVDAPETEVTLSEGGHPGSCRIKAVVNRQSLFLLIRWSDETEDRDPSGFESGPAIPFGPLFTGGLIDLTFPIDGPFPDDPLAPSRSTRDLWRWDARATDRSGHARDGNARTEVEPGSDRPWIPVTEADDCGVPPTGETPPSGSAADVLARGQWRNGEWTVEFARALSTGHADDRDLAGLTECPFTLSILDKSARSESHRGKGIGPPVLRLLLPPPLPEDRQGPFPEPRGGVPTGR